MSKYFTQLLDKVSTKYTAELKAEKPQASTREDMETRIHQVKSLISREAAIRLIKDVGGVDKLRDVPWTKIDLLNNAAKAELTKVTAARRHANDVEILKDVARAAYRHYREATFGYDCGAALATYINPQAAEHAKKFNDAMDKLEKLEPGKVPKERL